MRLIDADNARETACLDLTVHHIDRQPTVDAIIPVRCRDCKHWDEPYCMLCRARIGAAYWSKDMAYRKPDDFCSYGKAKSGTQPQREGEA